MNDIKQSLHFLRLVKLSNKVLICPKLRSLEVIFHLLNCKVVQSKEKLTLIPRIFTEYIVKLTLLTTVTMLSEVHGFNNKTDEMSLFFFPSH